MKIERVVPEFVEFIPPTPQPGIIYVSEAYRTAVHLCCCGCGRRVVTPLGPTDWRVSTSGTAVSLHPSIGNWNFPCQSHYWIANGSVVWARQWTSKQIASGRRADQRRKEAYFQSQQRAALAPSASAQPSTLWRRLEKALRDLWR